MQVSYLYLACWTAGIVLYVMGVARMVKKNIQPHAWHAIPAVLAAIGGQVYFWTQPNHSGAGIWVVYALSTLVTYVFLFGVSIITTGVMKSCNHQLCVNRDNGFVKFINDWVNERLWDGKSLCSISWLGAGVLISIPIIVLFGTLFGALVGVMCWFWCGISPVPFTVAGATMTSMPTATCKTSENGWPLSLGPYTLLLGVVTGVGWLIYKMFTWSPIWKMFTWSPIWFYMGRGALWLALALALAWGCALLLRGTKVTPEDEEGGDDSLGNYKRRIANRDYHSVGAVLSAPVGVAGLFWQVFRQRFCPKVKYMGAEEFAVAEDAGGGWD